MVCMHGEFPLTDSLSSCLGNVLFPKVHPNHLERGWGYVRRVSLPDSQALPCVAARTLRCGFYAPRRRLARVQGYARSDRAVGPGSVGWQRLPVLPFGEGMHFCTAVGCREALPLLYQTA